MQEKDQSCVFHQKYLEGSSWTAMEFEDFLWLGTWDQQETIEEYMPYLAIPFTFGCQTSVTGHFAKQYANGILGMARSLDENAFLNAMVKSNAIERAAFATCLTRMGGTLSLGGSGLARNDGGARQYHLEPMTFTNIIQDHGLYSLKVNKVLVGDFCITCAEDATNDKERIARRATLLAFRAGKGVLLDSGTTDTFLPKQAHRGLGKAWRAATGLSMQETRVYTYGQFRSMPDIRMVFHPNTTIVIPPSSYMDGVPRDLNATTLEEEVKRWAGSRKLTMRVYCEEPKGAVLGANAMYHYDVLYDLQDKRIGLARSFCGNQ
ncbi:aspartic [Seminavis robusta]|uniref:Aspartic n=1 Tax=Seminavis robusta TaxID=568900 RepID=A0A9N8H4L3_9STRA|nr:aspartic [Seminavis robusta]|eukprot:Sro66_g037120.1 aspartic (320) ;mRNA; f:53404-54453